MLTAFGRNAQNRITIVIPIAEAEADYIWRTIQDIAFFEKNNYQISLPQGTLIDELKAKSKAKKLSDKDYENLKRFVADSVYDKNAYEAGYKKIEANRILINKMVNQISKSKYKWDFKEFENYQINLTLYGPGGSYNSEEGSILIFTTPDGKFKSYDNPANTIIHEITHIGIEESIINTYQVPHALKERIVDTFVFLNFRYYLPTYKIQDMGEYRTDKYLSSKKKLKYLASFVEEVMKE